MSSTLLHWKVVGKVQGTEIYQKIFESFFLNSSHGQILQDYEPVLLVFIVRELRVLKVTGYKLVIFEKNFY